MSDIQLENNNGSIRLKFQVNGQRYSVTPVRRGKYGNKWDMGRARAIADLIQSDIESGCFDTTLSKYKPQSADAIQQSLKRAQKDISEIKQRESQKICLKELWNKYVDYKKPSISLSTLEVDYNRRIGNTLKALPTTNLLDTVAIRDWLIANKPSTQVKKILTQLSACCGWAVESKLIEYNPFLGMVGKIKTPKKTEEDDINPFTADERDKIIQAFQKSKYYSHYSYLIQFLFFTGCRPSEALALTWKDIKNDTITFNNSYVLGQKKKGLKTQKKRLININYQARIIVQETKNYLSQLQEKKKIFNNLHDLVFPSPEGNYIDWHNFSNRAWRKVLESLPGIEYRNPYQTRHTFITLALKTQKVDLKDLANFCGNSPKIILERYAGITRNFVMPEI
jgi:integrase